MGELNTKEPIAGLPMLPIPFGPLVRLSQLFSTMRVISPRPRVTMAK